MANKKAQKQEDNLTWEEYYNELNKYAQELNYKNAVDMREDLLNRTQRAGILEEGIQ